MGGTLSTSASPGDVAVFFEGGHVLVLLSGEVDLSLSDDLEHAGRDAIDAEQPIRVDARRVTFIDSVGGSFLVRMAAALIDRGGKLTLLGPSQRVEELISLMGAGEL